MGTIINKKKDYLTKFPLGVLAIFLIGFSPLIIGECGQWITNVFTEKPCENLNYPWMDITFLTPISLTIACCILAIYLLMILVDSITFLRKK